jgi:hypothetical protein
MLLEVARRLAGASRGLLRAATVPHSFASMIILCTFYFNTYLTLYLTPLG